MLSASTLHWYSFHSFEHKPSQYIVAAPKYKNYHRIRLPRTHFETLVRRLVFIVVLNHRNGKAECALACPQCECASLTTTAFSSLSIIRSVCIGIRTLWPYIMCTITLRIFQHLSFRHWCARETTTKHQN